MVAWTWRTPAATAAIEFATARSASLWVWMPHVTAGASGSASSVVITSVTTATSSSVSVPPFVSHRTSVREPAPRAARSGRERVVAIGLVAIEEVLGVVDDLASAIDDEADRIGDHVEVLGRRRAEDLGDVQQPALAEDRDDRRFGGDQLPKVRILLGAVRAMAGHPERGEPRPLPAHRAGGREELDVLRVRAGPAAFDERHPVLVEHPGDAQLVGERQRDVLALRAVAERRVVEDDRAVGCVADAHAVTSAPVPVPVAAPARSASTTAVANAVVPTTTFPSAWSERIGQVGRTPAGGKGRGDGRLDRVRGGVVAQRGPQQHRRREDRADRISDVAARDIGRRAMDRLVQAEDPVRGPA